VLGVLLGDEDWSSTNTPDMNDSGQNDSGMDVDMLEKEEAVAPASQRRVPASVPPNQNAVEAVNVPPPSRKGRHWTPQQRSDAKGIGQHRERMIGQWFPCS